MRIAVVALGVLGGCYRSFAEPPCAISCAESGVCPSGMVCGAAGRCETPGGVSCGALLDAPATDVAQDGMVDSALDSSIDAPAVACSPIAFTSDVTLTIGGSWMNGEHSPSRAVKEDNGVISAYEGNFDVPAATYASVIAPTGTEMYYAPRLWIGGDELTVIKDDQGTRTLMRATRLSFQSWLAPVEMQLRASDGITPIAIGPGEVASAPTALPGPRRILVSSGISLAEYTEAASLEWHLVRTIDPAPLGVTFLGEATLSPDGLRMVFRGQTTTVRAFVATRSSINVAFTTAAVQLPNDPTQSVQTPYLSANCQHLYYTASPDGTVHHVTYP